MAEAATIPTSTPKQLGKQLRAVRRQKGLSLSEVARGAGLSRRELVAYERGKIEIPDSDLWVLAGSCGVDVSELAPERGSLELEAGPESIGDTIAFLRRGQQNGGRAVRALEAADESEPQTHYSGPQAAPPPTPTPAPPAYAQPEPTTAPPVDVFEELARLPEPVPLSNDPGDYPDMLAPPAYLTADAPVDATTFDSAPLPPAGTFELVDDEPFPMPTSASVPDLQVAEYAGFDAPTVVDAVPDTIDRPWTPADSPPIDVALRGETYADPVDTAWTTDWQPDAQPDMGSAAWESGDWESATSGVWNEPDAASSPPEWSVETDAVAATPTWSPIDTFAPEDTDEESTNVITLTNYGDLRDLPPAQAAPPDQWTHEPDPEATSTGFLVDWGTPDEPAFEATEEIEAVDEIEGFDAYEMTAASGRDVVVDEPAPWEPAEFPPAPDEFVEPEGNDEPTPIFWHSEEGMSEEATEEAETLAPLDEPSPDGWTVADDEWELGNALPLVEIRGQGALVMRRADERWALANLTVSDRYLVEVDLEFRAGPGFGVLFRADVDDEGRMSAYSFDVDPVYEGGGYLVRQWLADRELWNPIAHVPANDPSEMYGRLTVRLELVNEQLIASVNNEVVMTVENLERGSLERGRNAPGGRRVGVQAWSSSDLVIETLRVADR